MFQGRHNVEQAQHDGTLFFERDASSSHTVDCRIDHAIHPSWVLEEHGDVWRLVASLYFQIIHISYKFFSELR
jgi:hypothetical protein